MSFTLRPYQEEANRLTAEGHKEHDSVLVEEATGLGKTVQFVKYASDYGRDGTLFNTKGRTLVICPQIELIGQAAKKLRKETGIQPAIEQASNWSNEVADWARSPFVVASKQTLTSKYNGGKRYERFKDVGLVIVDEAHYACTELYAELINWFRERGAKILGVTATANRHDGRAMGQVFDACVFQYGITDAIPDGWLVPIRVTCKQLEKLDLTGIESRRTPAYGLDFNGAQLNERLENPEVIYEICEAISQETPNQKTAVYCASVNEAQAVAELLVDNYGMKADWICAEKKRCTDQKRNDVMRSFVKDPDGLTHLVNVGILTTGWDFPGLMNIVNARPTRSLSLYTQIFGRLTRPIEENGMPVVDACEPNPEARIAAIAKSAKPFGRMIDLVDNALNHKIITAVDVLGGKWSLAERETLKEVVAKKTGPVDVDEELLSIKRELERQEEERLRRERAKRRAQAKFRDINVDPFEGRRSGSRTRSQKPMATDKQRRYLWVLGFKDIDKFPNISKGQAGRMITQLKRGESLAEVKRTNYLPQSEPAPVEQEDSSGGHGPPDWEEAFSMFR